MKKTILLLSAIFLLLQFVIAQKTDQTVALVRYSFSHLRDTTNKANVYTENMELLVGKNASVYRSADQRLHDEKMQPLITDRAKTGTTDMINFAGVGGPRGSTTKFYQFQLEKNLVRQEKIINIYLIEETLPVVNWKITSDTTSFGNLHCQKATTTFKGRNYEAWFCPALPFRSGPWKLNGLPGLIVEASDSKKEVIFKFAGLEDVSKMVEETVSTSDKKPENPILLRENYLFKTIGLPENGLKTTEKEFVRLKEAMKKNPQGFINSALAGSGATVKITNVTPTTTPVKNTINNPIELPEKP